jgi:hypothetical protein
VSVESSNRKPGGAVEADDSCFRIFLLSFDAKPTPNTDRARRYNVFVDRRHGCLARRFYTLPGSKSLHQDK